MERKEAIKIVRKLYNESLFIKKDKEAMVTLIPELEESEDERIMGNIIATIHLYYGEPLEDEAKEMIAWLEKQGEKLVMTDEEINDKALKAYPEMIYQDISSGWMVDKNKDKREGYIHALSKMFINQHQEKPTEIAEPKFKVGDWVVWDNKISCHVDNIYQGKESLMYTITDTNNMIRSYSVKGFDNNAHLWTIQDAKDGDVLVNWNNTIYLFKGIEEEVVKFYCYYNTNREEFNTPFDNNSHLGLTEPQFEHHPATKEQRDLLFKKMKEAGYEWDAEKRELKKIEQIQVIDYSDSLPKDNWELIHEFVNKFGRIPKDEDELNALIEYVLKRQNHAAWSEEDELHIRELESLVKQVWETAEHGNDKETIHKMSDLSFFLKTLKPQSKQEWSDEDENRINRLIAYFEDKESFTAEDDIVYANWLKSLKPRNRWKPSDEQMDAIDYVKNFDYGGYKDMLVSLYYDLKKLKDE